MPVFVNPPSWLKKRVRITAEALTIHRTPVVMNVRYKGITAFWTGWWLVDLQPGYVSEQGYIELKVRGARAKGHELDVKVPLSASRSSKRLFYVDWRIREIEFQPSTNGEKYSIHWFRLIPILRQFAVREMYGSLATGSRDLRGKPSKDLGDLLPRKEADKTGAHDQLMYQHYEEALIDSSDGQNKLYQGWIRFVEPKLFKGLAKNHAHNPKISVVIPVHNPNERHLRRAIESVLQQSYRNWELCIADDASDKEYVRTVIVKYRARDSRLSAVFQKTHGHIARTTNLALTLTTGDYIAFLDHDDELSPHALNEVVLALQAKPHLDIVYSDEDFLDPDGNRCTPHFKSDWNPYLLYSHNYVTHLCVYRSDLIARAGGMRVGFEGAQDYDLLLRCSQMTEASKIHHIPKVLYHWRMAEASTATDSGRKSYTHEAGKKALQDFFVRSNTPVNIESAGAENFYRVTFQTTASDPLVTLIVPTKDHVELLERCVDGMLGRTEYKNIEILIVDNGSQEPETLQYLEDIQERPSVRVVPLDEPFNYARICNFAAARARGEILGFVNNDVDVISADWLDEMVMLAKRPEIGCVGPKLLYADDTIQHAGVILGLGGYAAHSHRCFPRDSGGYFNRLKVRQNISAVTGACLIVRASVYREVGGMDEKLVVAYNDVDFCLQVVDAGYLNVFTPFALLYHFESKTRGYEDTAEKQARFKKEKNYLKRKWGGRIRLDPFYNPNLTHSREDFSIGS